MDMTFTPPERENAPSDSDGLVPLGWESLSARLSATHRLRRELSADASAHPRCATASFAPQAFDPRPCAPGQHPAREPLTLAHGNHDVNLEHLGDGKAQGTNCSGSTGREQPSLDCRTRGLQ